LWGAWRGCFKEGGQKRPEGGYRRVIEKKKTRSGGKFGQRGLAIGEKITKQSKKKDKGANAGGLTSSWYSAGEKAHKKKFCKTKRGMRAGTNHRDGQWIIQTGKNGSVVGRCLVVVACHLWGGEKGCCGKSLKRTVGGGGGGVGTSSKNVTAGHEEMILGMGGRDHAKKNAGSF